MNFIIPTWGDVDRLTMQSYHRRKAKIRENHTLHRKKSYLTEPRVTALQPATCYRVPVSGIGLQTITVGLQVASVRLQVSGCRYEWYYYAVLSLTINMLH